MKAVILIAVVSLVLVGARSLPGGPRPIDTAAVASLASTLSGRQIALTCSGSSNVEGETESITYDGFVRFADSMRINTDLCRSLSGLLADPPRLDDDSGRAVLVITHESDHIRLLSTDDGVTECTAYHDLPHTISVLQLDRGDAARVLIDAESEHDRQPLVWNGVPNRYRTVC